MCAWFGAWCTAAGPQTEQNEPKQKQKQNWKSSYHEFKLHKWND